MDTEEDEALARQAGWFKLRRGWYHPDAWNYPGWWDSPRCYPTARELVEAEGLRPPSHNGCGCME